VQRGKLTEDAQRDLLGRVRFTTSLEELAAAELVIEAVPERLDLKQEGFSALDKICPPTTILATNTSSLSVTEISVATGRPSAVIGMHFFNPAPLLPLVEIIRAEKSSDEALNAAFQWAEQAGKQPVRANDAPGFIVNRILVPTLNECIRLLDEGITVEDLDKAMTMGVGWPMGPCTLVDLVGIDIHIHAAEAMYEATGDERARPPERLREMAAEGRLGRKTGRGFYDYESR